MLIRSGHSPSAPTSRIRLKTLNRPLEPFLKELKYLLCFEEPDIISGNRIGIFRDTEGSYRRGFLRWTSRYKDRGCVYIWAWAWNNSHGRGRPKLEHPTSGKRENKLTRLYTAFPSLTAVRRKEGNSLNVQCISELGTKSITAGRGAC